MDLTDKIKKYIEKHDKVTIHVSAGEDIQSLHGFIVNVSKQYLCLLELDDFHLDGYCIIPKKYITEIKSGKYEKVYKKILTREGITDKVTNPSWLKLGSAKSILSTIMKNVNIVTIESALPEVDEFVIGEIIAVEEKTTKLRAISADCKWLDGKYVIPHSEITLIRILDEYATTFRKYVA